MTLDPLWANLLNSDWHDHLGSGHREDRIGNDAWLRVFLDQAGWSPESLPGEAGRSRLRRLRATLRRGRPDRSPLLKVADLTLDPASRRVMRGGDAIDLTAKEYALLEYLMRSAGRVLTRTMISEHVWDQTFDSYTNVIDVYVNYLRKKIDQGREPKLIHTVRGVGYVLREEP